MLEKFLIKVFGETAGPVIMIFGGILLFFLGIVVIVRFAVLGS